MIKNKKKKGVNIYMKNNIVYIVFEYAEPTNKIIGIYKNKKYAKKAHMESPSWRYIEEHIVH